MEVIVLPKLELNTKDNKEQEKKINEKNKTLKTTLLTQAFRMLKEREGEYLFKNER